MSDHSTPDDGLREAVDDEPCLCGTEFTCLASEHEAEHPATPSKVGRFITLLHAFDGWSGMCRCGEGPFTTAEWLAHYQTQDEPVRVTTAAPEAEETQQRP